jgi:hypothetical protein
MQLNVINYEGVFRWQEKVECFMKYYGKKWILEMRPSGM